MRYVAVLILPLFIGCGRDNNATKTDSKRIAAQVIVPKTVLAGEEIEFVLRLDNVGSRPIRLRAIKPGCGCTSLDYASNDILPNEQLDIVGTISSRTRLGSHSLALNAVFEDDSTLLIDVNVEVVSGIEIQSVEIELRPDFNLDGQCETQFVFRNTLSTPVSLTFDEMFLPDAVQGFQVTPASVHLQPSQEAQIRISCSHSQIVTVKESLRFLCSGNSSPHIVMPIHIIPVSAVTLTKRSIHLGYITEAKLNKTLSSLTVNIPRGSPWYLKDVSAPNYLTVTNATAEGGRTCHLSLYFKPDADIPSAIKTVISLSFHSNLRNVSQTVTIPVNGFIASNGPTPITLTKEGFYK